MFAVSIDLLNKRFVDVSNYLDTNSLLCYFFPTSLSKAMNKIMSNSTKQSPFQQNKTSIKQPSTSFERRVPEWDTEQVKIDPFGASSSNTINSASTSHANKFKQTLTAVLDPFGSDAIDGTILHRTNKWKKVPEVGSIVNGSLKMTSKHNEDEFGRKKIFKILPDK